MLAGVVPSSLFHVSYKLTTPILARMSCKVPSQIYEKAAEVNDSGNNNNGDDEGQPTQVRDDKSQVNYQNTQQHQQQ